MTTNVPNNAMQRRIFDQYLESQRVPQITANRIPCKIVDVYDLEEVGFSELPKQLQNLISSAPGQLWCKVLITRDNNRQKGLPDKKQKEIQMYLPFEKTVEEIYSVVGNGAAIIGRSAMITYHGYNISAGKVSLIPESKQQIININKSTKVYDIGGVL